MEFPNVAKVYMTMNDFKDLIKICVSSIIFA